MRVVLPASTCASIPRFRIRMNVHILQNCFLVMDGYERFAHCFLLWFGCCQSIDGRSNNFGPSSLDFRGLPLCPSSRHRNHVHVAVVLLPGDCAAGEWNRPEDGALAAGPVREILDPRSKVTCHDRVAVGGVGGPGQEPVAHLRPEVSARRAVVNSSVWTTQATRIPVGIAARGAERSAGGNP